VEGLGKIFIWTRVCIGCRSPRQSNPGVNELQTRGKRWLALLKYKMSKAAKTWRFPRTDSTAKSSQATVAPAERPTT
jgi:hypothetical protein